MFTCLECQCTYQGTGPRCEQCAQAISAQADDASAGFNQAPEKYDEMHELYSKMFPSPRNAMLVKDMAASKVGGPALNTMVGLWNGRPTVSIAPMTDEDMSRLMAEALRPGPIELVSKEPALTTLLGWDMAQWAHVCGAEGFVIPLSVEAAHLLQRKYLRRHANSPPSLAEMSQRLNFSGLQQFVVHMEPTKADAPLPKAEILSVVIGTDPGGRSYSVDEHGEFHVDDPVDKVAVDLSTTRVLR